MGGDTQLPAQPRPITHDEPSWRCPQFAAVEMTQRIIALTHYESDFYLCLIVINDLAALCSHRNLDR